MSSAKDPGDARSIDFILLVLELFFFLLFDLQCVGEPDFALDAKMCIVEKYNDSKK